MHIKNRMNFEVKCPYNQGNHITGGHISEGLLYLLCDPNFTDWFQPLDVSINRAAKDFLQAQFMMSRCQW